MTLATIRDLGIQSWCFREFVPLSTLIEQIKSIGLSRVELCAVHVDFNDESIFAPTLTAFHDAGITITSIGVQKFSNNPVQEAKWFAFCKAAGADMISAAIDVSAMPHSLQLAADLSTKHDIKVAIHNHGGYDWLGSRMMLRHILKHMPPSIGVCLDTAWMMQAGEDVLAAAQEFAESGRLYGVHLKDFTFDRAGKWQDVVTGTGALPLKPLLALIHKTPECRCVTLEYEADAANPAPVLRQCLTAINAAI